MICDYYGLLDFRQDRVLTKDGYSRTRWNLPDFFKKVSISHNPKPWKNGYFQSASIGQEFIMEAIPEIQNWAKESWRDRECDSLLSVADR